MLTKLRWLSDNFASITPARLHGDLKDLYKLRIGDWRVVYEFDEADQLLVVRFIGHRHQVYRS